MSDKALVKVHFVPFVIILLLKLLCMKLCLIVTSVTIPILFKCLLLLHFISYQEQHSKQLSRYSYQSRQNSDLWRTKLPYVFLFITENKNHTFKCIRYICSALPIARKFFYSNILLCSFFPPIVIIEFIKQFFIFLSHKWNILQE